MNDWQPIETAPKDGSTFLSCNVNQGNVYGITWWSKTYEYWCSTGGQALYQFTHWMPLPPKTISHTPDPPREQP